MNEGIWLAEALGLVDLDGRILIDWPEGNAAPICSGGVRAGTRCG